MLSDNIKPSDLEVRDDQKTRQTTSRRNKREDRLLPIMTRLLVGLAIFFLLVTTAQMAYLHFTISQSSPVDLNPSSEQSLTNVAVSFDDHLTSRKLEILAKMEAYIVENRYHQASVSLMAGLWLRYLGFVTGMILALVGASFVLGKLREPVTEFKGSLSSIDLSLRSTSPGIILVILGAALMIATIVDEDTYLVEDYRIYLTGMETPVSEDLGSMAEPPPEFWETPIPDSTLSPVKNP